MGNGDTNSGSHEETPRMNSRDRMNQKLAQPVDLKTVAILIVLAGVVWGSAEVWGSFTATSEIADATTKIQLKAIELKHDKDIDQQRSALQEFDSDLHDLDHTQTIMRVEQQQQTKLLEEIKQDIKKAHGGVE
ncbi:hypothetical protein LCGC14_1801100 [marine sediment metagenome]|uniref:Uncharacterized protein n=1 Tax=marine sediment metagenome TaxID=412755 RepID=A0A0F9J4G1_9ZZZZ